MAFGMPEPALRSIARRASGLYIGPKPKPKKNGGIRYVFDTKAPLKPLLKKINKVFFRRVEFPLYLTGSLAGRDFVAHVDIHKGARWAITEDIAKFFDCISDAHVYHIWHKFFGFSKDVADLLTHMTTKDGRVFQGTPTSSYLANLAFWEREPALGKRLTARGIRYSRYVDDITMSSTEEMDESIKRWAISQVYAMIGGAGFKPQRAKHAVFTARAPITIMGLNANGRLQPTLTKQERSKTRAQVFQVENRLVQGETGAEIRHAVNQAGGKVGRLKRLHVRRGVALRARLDSVRHALDVQPFVTQPVEILTAGEDMGGTDPF